MSMITKLAVKKCVPNNKWYSYHGQIGGLITGQDVV